MYFLFVGLTTLLGCAFESGALVEGDAADQTLPSGDVPAPTTAGNPDRFPAAPSPGAVTPGASASDSVPPPSFGDAGLPMENVPPTGTPPAVPPPPGTPPTTTPPTQTPPERGAPLSLCTIDEGCDGDLICVGKLPGFCTDPCEDDGDCHDGGAFVFACDDSGACLVRCDGDGDCPAGFACELPDGATSEGMCRPSFVPGNADKQALEPCSMLRGDSDCVEGLVCYRWDSTQQDGPGYCTAPCTSSSQCELPAEGTTDLGCGSEGGCRFRCTDADCPVFLECEEVEGDGGRCRYPLDTPL